MESRRVTSAFGVSRELDAGWSRLGCLPFDEPPAELPTELLDELPEELSEGWLGQGMRCVVRGERRDRVLFRSLSFTIVIVAAW